MQNNCNIYLYICTQFINYLNTNGLNLSLLILICTIANCKEVNAMKILHICEVCTDN